MPDAVQQNATSAVTSCPGCGVRAVSVIDDVPTAELTALYRSRGVEVGSYFEGVRQISRCHCDSCDLHFFSPSCAGDDHFYEQLQQFDWYYQDAKPEYEYCKKFIQGTARVLEVGCGKGAFRAFLPDSVSYAGLEFNDEAVRKANAAGLNVVKQSIEEHAASRPGGYDVVCSFQVLEHVPDPKTFVHACVDALAPGGMLLVAVPSEDSFLSLAANAPLNMPPHHVLRWTDRALTNLARRESLTLVELWHEPVSSDHRMWHLQTLAHHYFVTRGLARTRLIDRSLRARLIGRLLRNDKLRRTLAQKVLDSQPQLARGHTVVLAARRH
jgi:SAM-dependent methyltransferase